ncbi:MAG: aldo/keto reductase [Actinomycetia bacterium]|nr:aldo/keto reductase [Actinomycetes bacterium]
MSSSANSDLTTIAFGTTGMNITRVGFGAWAVGGTGWSGGWGPQDDSESVAAIRRAVERGVNWVDTAWVYGYGHSESVVREALSVFSDADRPYVFTKCGPVEPSVRTDDPIATGDPKVLREQVVASLRRLGTDSVDLMQMHWEAEDGVELEVYWQALLDMKAEGLYRAVGLSNFDTSELERAEALGHVDTLQPPFSAIDRRAAADLLPWCNKHETGVIVYSPMHAGLLTGAFSAERVASLPEDDWRKSDDDFTDNLTANLAVASAMVKVAERHGVSTAAAAAAWTIAWPAVSGAIVGARSAAQVDGWLDAATLRYDAEDLQIVAEAIGASGAGEGPALPR